MLKCAINLLDLNKMAGFRYKLECHLRLSLETQQNRQLMVLDVTDGPNVKTAVDHPKSRVL